MIGSVFPTNCLSGVEFTIPSQTWLVLTWNGLLYFHLRRLVQLFHQWNSGCLPWAGTSLRKSLRTCAGCLVIAGVTSEFWTVSGCYWVPFLSTRFTVIGSGLTTNCLSGVKGYSSIWCERVSSLTWNHLFPCFHLRRLVQLFHQLEPVVTTLEGRSTVCGTPADLCWLR